MDHSNISWLAYLTYPDTGKIQPLHHEDRIELETFLHSALKVAPGVTVTLFKMKYVRGRVLLQERPLRQIADLIKARREKYAVNSAEGNPRRAVAAPEPAASRAV